MDSDQTHRPPTVPSTRTSVAEELGVPSDRVKHFRLDVMEWARARGFKPLPGKDAGEGMSPEEPRPPAPLPFPRR